MNSRRGAFTLLELLVVIAVIGVLATLAIVAFRRVVESAKATECSSNLRQLGAALATYLGEHEMIMPTLKAGREKLSDEEPVIDNTLDRYLKTRDVFACPADRRWAKQTGTSYYWNVALNAQSMSSLNFLKLADETSRIPVIADKEGFHPYTETKVNILYADGHASKDVSFVSEPK